MYQLDMAKVQADVVKACISYHKRENWLTTAKGLKTRFNKASQYAKRFIVLS